MKIFRYVASRKFYPLFVFLLLITAVFFWKSVPKTESAKTENKNLPTDIYDIRADKSDATQEIVEKFNRESSKDFSTVSAKRKDVRLTADELKLSKNWNIEFNNDLRNVGLIASEVGTGASFLTAASREKKPEILRRFLKENSALFGLDETQIGELETTADYTNPNGILSFVHLVQKISGIPVFQGEVKAGFTKRGEMFRVINKLAPFLDYQTLKADFGDVNNAVISAAKSIGITATENDLKKTGASENDLKITFGRGQFSDETTAEKIYFPFHNGTARAAWRILLWTKTDAFYVIVDAQDGTVLRSESITENQTLPATFNVYGNTTSLMQTADSPAPCTPGCNDPNNCPQAPVIARQNFTLVGNESPNSFNNIGWIPDDGLPVRTPANPNITDGNNCEVGLDRDGTNGVDPDGHAVGNPFRIFNFNYNPAPGNPPPGDNPLSLVQQLVPPTEFQKGVITNGFYLVNRWHDEMYKLGFTEQARNFQHFNFGRGGTEGDRISFEIQDSSGTNSANFSTPTDGGRGRMQMFIWTGSTPQRDGALDSTVVVHEVTHGLSSRLHNGLGNQGGMMGEGWSDFYASALLSEPADDLCGTYPTGSYVSYQITPTFTANHYYGVRRFPTARINCLGSNGRPHNPLTFRHINADCDATIGTTTTAIISAFPRNPVVATSGNCSQVHNGGEIWTQSLWEVRGLLIEQHGAVEGNRRVLQYVTDGMKLAPSNPNMLQERDAIIASAFASNPSDVRWIREGFRRRGMGFSARVISATEVVEAFDFPNIQVVEPFSVSDSTGNNNGYPEAGEMVLLNVTVTNQSGETQTNVYVNVNGGTNVNVGTVANGQTVQAQIRYKIPRLNSCTFQHQVTINAGSDAGMQTPKTFSFRLGVPIGGPPAEFTNSTPIDMPNGQPTTTSGNFAPYPSNITVAGLTGRKTIKIRLNGYHHEFEDDVDLLLVGPNGQRYIFMSDVGGSTEQLTPITFTVSDSGSNLLPDTTAIINGVNYKPSNVVAGDVFGAPAPATPYANAAPTGSDTFASVFGTDGAAMNGTWSLYGVDDAGSDPGRIDSGWTLIFEADDYICTTIPDSPRADFDGDGKTDLSVFRPTEGNWYLNRSTSGFTAINWGLSGDVLVPGDYDGDNITDTAIKRGGDWFILRSCDSTTAIVNWGLSSDIPVSGDYDGDLKNDFAVFRPSQGNWYVLRSSDGGNVIFNWGLSTDRPIAGDFDGDGKTDFTVYRGGVWYINGSSTGVKIVTFGLSSDMPVPADYDGDRRDDIAVFRPSDGYWYILRSSNNAVDYVQFGSNGDVPVPGDYDGDGRYDQAVYRGGVWYLNRSTAGFAGAQFGLAADNPVPKAYIP